MSFVPQQPPAPPTYGPVPYVNAPMQPWPPMPGGPGMPGAPMMPGVPMMPPPAPAKPDRKGEVEGLALLAVVIVIHLAANLYWLYADHHLVHLDEAHHLKQALAYYEILFAPGDAGMAERAMTALGVESPYPPLMHLLGALCLRLFGGAPDSAALAGSVALALLLTGVYVLARQGLSPRNAFLAALATGFIPMVFGYSRLFMPDTLMGAWIIWSATALLKTSGFRKNGWSAVFGFLAGLALLSKQHALIYLVPLVAGAMAVGLGGAIAARFRKAPPPEKGQIARVLMNVLLCGCMLSAVCGWWYIRHAEYVYTWWSTQGAAGQRLFQPAIAGPLSGLLPDLPENQIVLDPDLAQSSASSESGETGLPAESLLEPFHRDGYRYLYYLVNDALFLPLALLALFGIPALLLKRNQSAVAMLWLLWPTGVWLLLTGAFAVHSPRFLYPVLPAAACLAVLALDAVPRPRLRQVLWCGLGIALLFQFINLTFFSMGPIKRLELPLYGEESAVMERGNQGITVFKEVIQTGHYIIQSPRRDIPVPEILVEKMCACDSHFKQPGGPAAWYQMVSDTPSLLGMDFYTRVFPRASWTGAGVSEEQAAARRPLAAVKPEVSTPEASQPEVAGAEFVVLKQSERAPQAEQLESDVAFFMAQGFKSVFNGFFPGQGAALPGNVHLMARPPMPALTGDLNLFELYDILDRDGREWVLTDDERMEAEQQYARLVKAYTVPRPLTDQISFLGIHVAAVAEDWYVIRLILHVRENSPDLLRVWLRGTPVVSAQENRSGAAEMSWDFDPQPPSTTWKRNQAVLLSRPVMVKPQSFLLEVGLHNPEEEDTPLALVETEVVDFAQADRQFLCETGQP